MLFCPIDNINKKGLRKNSAQSKWSSKQILSNQLIIHLGSTHKSINEKPWEKLLYQRIQNLHCISSVVHVLLLINNYNYLHLKWSTMIQSMIQLFATDPSKYIGITFDEHLIFQRHIKLLNAKIKRANNLLAISRH